jgi:hypothetical protein
MMGVKSVNLLRKLVNEQNLPGIMSQMPPCRLKEDSIVNVAIGCNEGGWKTPDMAWFDMEMHWIVTIPRGQLG